MTWFLKLKDWIANTIAAERSAHKLALSCAWGMYIAITPFMGLHTVLVFIGSWYFSLNGAVALLVSKVVNNPLSVVPLYAISHALGCFMLQLMAINPLALNPSWMMGLNQWISSYTGMTGISLGALFIGTHLIGIIAAFVSYLVVKWYVEIYHQQGSYPSINIIKISRKNAQNLVARVQPLILQVIKGRVHRSA